MEVNLYYTLTSSMDTRLCVLMDIGDLIRACASDENVNMARVATTCQLLHYDPKTAGRH